MISEQQVIYSLIPMIVLLIGLTVLLFKYVMTYKKVIKEMEKKYNKLIHQKKSSEVRLGKIGENLAPLVKDWPYDAKNFRFLGYPVDGVQYNDDSIIFMEIKTGGARLSKSQNNIKNLVEEGKVYFETYRISEDGVSLKRAENN